ncbi:transporter substrate-binding domain-containing protein [Pseudomonas indica]|uniref:Cyclohexadienyl dehydratase n=1 Tax=Pseudomonas indica TaxID=137658 RepID=A0A1G9L7J5_9PSED|nr:transporter substrate-binding domain-containing protein [Pseudomonas indica]SDL57723.1 cyclohexadienyl dehydratase [Pseudomonas indica]
MHPFRLFRASVAQLTVACLLLASQALTAAQAEPNRLDRILESGVLRVGTTGDYKPFSYKDPKSGQFIGLDVEMGESLAKALGVKLELVPTSWPTLMADLAADKYDVAMSGVSVSLERQKVAFFSQPYMRDGKTPITLCSNKDKFQSLEQIDRAGVRAIVNPGGTNEKFARANLKQAEIVMHPDNVTIFEQIVQGKADLMMTDAVETRLQSRLHPELCALHPDQPFDFSEKAYLIPRDLVFKQFVDQWLRQDIESGTFAKRFDQWLNYPWQAANKP